MHPFITELLGSDGCDVTLIRQWIGEMKTSRAMVTTIAKRIGGVVFGVE